MKFRERPTIGCFGFALPAILLGGMGSAFLLIWRVASNSGEVSFSDFILMVIIGFLVRFVLHQREVSDYEGFMAQVLECPKCGRQHALRMKIIDGPKSGTNEYTEDAYGGYREVTAKWVWAEVKAICQRCGYASRAFEIKDEVRRGILHREDRDGFMQSSYSGSARSNPDIETAWEITMQKRYFQR